MKRRDFVKSTAIGALGSTLISPLGSLAEGTVTHLESSDLSPSAVKDEYGLHFIAVVDWGRNGEYDQAEVCL